MTSNSLGGARYCLTQVAHSALAAWSIAGTPVSLSLLKYRENAVYAVNVDGKPAYVLRVHRRGYHSDAALRSELLWMRALNEHGVPTPHVVESAVGDVITLVSLPEFPGPYQCDLLSWVGGSQLGKIEERSFGDQAFIEHAYQHVGRLAAQVHLHSEWWQPPASFSRSSWDEEGCMGRQGLWGYYANLATLTAEQRLLLHRGCEVARRRLAEYGKSNQRYGLIHGDLLPENVLLDGERCTLIDFDDAGFGWYVAEIAVAVFFQVGTPSFTPALDAMIRGYRQVRELPDSELGMLDVMLFLRGTAVLGWLHTRAETEMAKTLRPVITDICVALAAKLLGGSTSSAANRWGLNPSFSSGLSRQPPVDSIER